MSDFPYICGADVRKIENKEFARFETTKANEIVFALDKSNIPYFAQYGNTDIVLTYDGNFKDSVNEIISKIMSGGYDEMLREIKDKKNTDGYLILLSEVADVLHTTVGTLKARPMEVQELLCKSYVDFWLCDIYTIQRELDRIITVNGRTLQDMQEHERKEFQNNMPEKCDVANQSAHVGYITNEIRRKNAEELRRKQYEHQRTSQFEERERTKKP